MSATIAPERATPPGLAGTDGGQTAPSGRAMPRATVRKIRIAGSVSESWGARRVAQRLVRKVGSTAARYLLRAKRDQYVQLREGTRRVTHPDRYVFWDCAHEAAFPPAPSFHAPR